MQSAILSPIKKLKLQFLYTYIYIKYASFTQWSLGLN